MYARAILYVGGFRHRSPFYASGILEFVWRVLAQFSGRVGMYMIVNRLFANGYPLFALLPERYMIEW